MSDNDLIRRGDALAAVREWTYCCDAEDAIAALPAVSVGVPTEAQIASACLSYDHSFGLMDGPQRVTLMHQAREWFHAWRKEFAALEPVTAPDPALRPTMTDMMVDPNTLDAFMEANPLPPDPAPAKQVTVSEAEAIREAALHVENAKRLRRYDWQEWTAQDVEDAEGIICAFLALIERGTDQ